MININIDECSEDIRIYNCGILILEESSYNEVVFTIKEALTIIQDDLYQIYVLNSILKRIQDIEGLVA